MGVALNLSLVHNNDNGAASVASNVSIMKKVSFYKSSSNPDVKFSDNLIVWTLANRWWHNAGIETEPIPASPRHSCDTTLAPVSYCKPGFTTVTVC